MKPAAHTAERAGGGPDRLAQALRLALVVVAGLYLLAVAGVVLPLMGYDCELEWMEGEQLDHVLRVLAGQRIYVRPSLAFVPAIYTPLYYYVSGAVAMLVGEGFLPLRLVSVASTAVAFALLYRMASREAESRLAGALACGLFAATYGASGFWFGLARVDMLFAALTVSGLCLTRFGRGMASAGAAGLVFALAFLTKQTAVVVAACGIAYALAVDRRRGAVLAATTAALVGASVVALNAVHDGWFLFYTVTVPARHKIEWDAALGFWTHDILPPLFVGVVLAVVYLWREALWGEWRRSLFYGLAAAGLFAASWLARSKAGGDVNTLIPAHLALALLFGIGACRVSRLTAPAYGRRAGRGLLLYGLCLVQLALLAYNPLKAWPGRHDREEWSRLVVRLSMMEGDVWVLSHSYLGPRAGKPPHAHGWALRDVLRSGTEAGEALRAELREALRERRFAAIVCDDHLFAIRAEIEQHYWPRGPVLIRPDACYPVTGLRVRPEIIYWPRPVGGETQQGNGGGDGAPSARDARD